jgi:hypothetical protein
LFGGHNFAIRTNFSFSEERRMKAHFDFDNTGMKAELLVIAPNPESRPRITVPTTMRHARAAVIASVLLGEWRAGGRRMWEKRKR